jgi:hypothetical protein
MTLIAVCAVAHDGTLEVPNLVAQPFDLLVHSLRAESDDARAEVAPLVIGERLRRFWHPLPRHERLSHGDTLASTKKLAEKVEIRLAAVLVVALAPSRLDVMLALLLRESLSVAALRAPVEEGEQESPDAYDGSGKDSC